MSSYTTYEDDATLTAYALGELEGEEATEVEARLADDPEARLYVDQLRATAGTLTAAFKAEGASPAMAIEHAHRSRRGRWVVALAAAATFAAVGVTTYLVMEQTDDRRRLALGDEAAVDSQPMATREPAGSPGPAAGDGEWQMFDSAGAMAGGDGHRSMNLATPPADSPAPAPGLLAKPTPSQDPAGYYRDERGLASQPSATRAPSRSEEIRVARQRQAEAGEALTSLSADMALADAEGKTEAAAQIRQQIDRIAGALPAEDAEALGDVLGEGRFRQDFHTEAYDRVVDNEFKRVAEHPLSTFSVDVDTASYANVRRFLAQGQLPPPDAVRIEELVNYFDYQYTPPTSREGEPFSADVEIAAAPWNPTHRLVRIGLKGYEVPDQERKPTNLVFLLDVSGSMNDVNKLPLVKESMKLLVDKLDERDNVAIAVYAGSSGLVLPATSAGNTQSIKAAIDALNAGGSTNGAQGIELAYETARKGFIKEGVNRVILCTDGDFNIGVTDRGQLTRLIEEQAESGVYLSVLGFGMGNYKDATMEELTNKGEGNYAYIDTESEARKVLVEQMAGTLEAIAKDVKIQVEFNPAEVASYRLIGYENRILAKEDFNDDTKDAGDIGAGHEVTALYEVVPSSVAPQEIEKQIAALQEEKAKLEQVLTQLGELTPEAKKEIEARIEAIDSEIESLGKLPEAKPPVDDLRYQEEAPAAAAAASGEMLTVKLRYKAPDAPKEQGTSSLIEFPVKDEGKAFDEADGDFQFAAGVAGFGMLLRDSPYKGTLTWDGLGEMTGSLEHLREARLSAEGGRRLEFRELVQKAAQLATQKRE